MDSLAWMIQAIPFGDHLKVTEALNSFRATVLPYESTQLLQFHSLETGSTAILPILDALGSEVSALRSGQLQPNALK